MVVYETRCLVARPAGAKHVEDWIAPLREQSSVFELMAHVEGTPSSNWILSVATVCTTERLTGRRCQLFYRGPLRIFYRKFLNACPQCEQDPCECLPF